MCIRRRRLTVIVEIIAKFNQNRENWISFIDFNQQKKNNTQKKVLIVWNLISPRQDEFTVKSSIMANNYFEAAPTYFCAVHYVRNWLNKIHAITHVLVEWRQIKKKEEKNLCTVAMTSRTHQRGSDDEKKFNKFGMIFYRRIIVVVKCFRTTRK